MQKIIIKNFGAIKEVEIEINKVLVLIGEQASGKSTIAKLIYFFKSLKDELFNKIYQDFERDYFDTPKDLVFPIREKFYDYFGSTYHLPDFEITYYYNVEEERFLKLSLEKTNRKLFPKFSRAFLTKKFRDNVSAIKKTLQKEFHSKNVHEQLAFEQNRLSHIRNLSNFINNAFHCFQDTSLFVIAGRNATVSYSDLFEKYLFANIQNQIEENIKQTSFKKKEYTIDESLMLSFIERVSKMKGIFEKYGGFVELTNFYSNNSGDIDTNNILDVVCKKTERILKGNYSVSREGERIVVDGAVSQIVYLHNASSGQQESIRVLQDIFLAVADKQKILRIIEEPEAHLFPDAQKLMIELLALLANADEDNQVIITTHSPYVLSVFNNLLFAGRVIEKNESLESKVGEIIDPSSILSSEDFSAYSLQKEVGKSKSQSESIVSKQTGLIEQNYLDTVSELLNGDFKKLYELHAKSFARA